VLGLRSVRLPSCV